MGKLSLLNNKMGLKHKKRYNYILAKRKKKRRLLKRANKNKTKNTISQKINITQRSKKIFICHNPLPGTVWDERFYQKYNNYDDYLRFNTNCYFNYNINSLKP